MSTILPSTTMDDVGQWTNMLASFRQALRKLIGFLEMLIEQFDIVA
jgi:hypothetical protein